MPCPKRSVDRAIVIRMSTTAVIVIAGRERSISDCVHELRRYPGRTITRYDLPGPGHPTTLTHAEVARTRTVYSRISEQQLSWFVERATSAPWPPADADLRRAEPSIRNGLYDQLEAFYRHFEKDAPSQVGRSKISKVLHIKRPAALPILDSSDRRLPSERHASRRTVPPPEVPKGCLLDCYP
jgi:hypothetical protein